MNKDVNILIAEDDEGHATLIIRNLRKAGITNNILQFQDGEEVLNFLLSKGSGLHRKTEAAYLLLLDIRMPKIDGVEVLRQIKNNDELKKMPVIIITTTDDPREISICHELGCNCYISKPIDYDKFVNAIKQLGMFLLVVQVPELNNSDLAN
jgi:CheY-like chemotaxis protein